MQRYILPNMSLKEYRQKNREAVLTKIHENTDLVIDGFMTSARADYRWLSNFHLSELEFHGLKFSTAEAAYHSFKTFLDEERQLLATASNGPTAKKLGQKVALRPDWEVVKCDIMELVLRQKFKPGSELGEKLKATYPADLRPIVWWHDNFWESCICSKCGNRGLNMLGQILEKIRSDLLQINNNNE